MYLLDNLIPWMAIGSNSWLSDENKIHWKCNDNWKLFNNKNWCDSFVLFKLRFHLERNNGSGKERAYVVLVMFMVLVLVFFLCIELLEPIVVIIEGCILVQHCQRVLSPSSELCLSLSFFPSLDSMTSWHARGRSSTMAACTSMSSPCHSAFRRHLWEIKLACDGEAVFKLKYVIK